MTKQDKLDFKLTKICCCCNVTVENICTLFNKVLVPMNLANKNVVCLYFNDWNGKIYHSKVDIMPSSLLQVSLN